MAAVTVRQTIRGAMEYGVSRNKPAPLGMLLEFIRSCNFGNKGEVKFIAHYIAVHLLEKGIAIISEPADLIQKKFLDPASGSYSVAVTAICPTFNRRKYLPTTINLFLEQTFKNSELLIVDDSYESVEDLIPKHPRVRYVRLTPSERREPPYGHDGRMLIGAKRNICCAEARGEFIVHWDDDDWQSPDRIAHQVTALVNMNKQVLTYCNILYWNEETQMACRCFPRKELRALHGATFCYRKSWWVEHPFKEVGGGEDTTFGTEAMRHNQLLIVDAEKHMVVRAHGNNDQSAEDRGNTCRTSDHMGTGAIPKTARADIPEGFWQPLAASVVFEPLPHKDAVVGVIRGYDWQKVKTYANSLSRSGFSGEKLMFVENISAETRENLLGLGFILVDFTTPPDVQANMNADYLTFGRYRFKPVLDYLKRRESDYRFLLWCDVRDLVFQSNPIVWLEKNLKAPHKIVASGEGWLVKDEPYNDRWNKKVNPKEYHWMRELDVLCSGFFAGEASAMLDVFARVFALTAYAPRPDGADQAMFQRVVRTSPYKEVTLVPRMSEGFCATWFTAKNNDPKLIPNYGKPVFDSDGTVYAPDTNVPFAVVHQYDRDGTWEAVVMRKYA